MNDTTKSLIFIVFLISIIVIVAYSAIKEAPTQLEVGPHGLNEYGEAGIIINVEQFEIENMGKG